MNGWLLDTNVIAELSGRKPHSNVLDWRSKQPEELLFISVLTLAEYDRGVHNLANDDPRTQRLLAAVDALELRFRSRILPLGNAAIRRWGRVSGITKRMTSHWPAVVDTLLAASAVEYGLYLVTRNVRDVARSGAVISIRGRMMQHSFR